MSPEFYLFLFSTRGVSFQCDCVLWLLTVFCKKMHDLLGSRMMGCDAWGWEALLTSFPGLIRVGLSMILCICKCTARELCYQRIKCDMRQRDANWRMGTILCFWEHKCNGLLKQKLKEYIHSKYLTCAKYNWYRTVIICVRELRIIGYFLYSGKGFSQFLVDIILHL